MTENVLTTAFEMLTPLHRPIMVIALRGLFDIAEVATDAIETLTSDRVAPIVASIDPDPFYDFTQERPHVEFDDDGDEVRVIRGPQNQFDVVRGQWEAFSSEAVVAHSTELFADWLPENLPGVIL